MKELARAEATLRLAAAQPHAAPKVRQNLALVVGLQGRFAEAETIASADLPPDEAAANVAYLRQMLAQRNDLTKKTDRDVHAQIRDRGVGVFTSVAERHNLPEEEAAIGELMKGKATSLPERHAGEGIFFTSKACDSFSLRSHRLELIFDTRRKDTFVNVRAYLRGTDVALRVSRSARRRLKEVFSAFAPEEFEFRFDRSLVTVRFLAREHVSRSEARRLLARLDQFREVILDFSGVRSIGQGFADEIFRVFAHAHPEVALKRVNVLPGIEAVIRHVVDNKKQEPLTME